MDLRFFPSHRWLRHTWLVLTAAFLSLLLGPSGARSAADARVSASPVPPTAAHRAYVPLLLAPTSPPTSEQLINEALARGEIDDETALIYRVFAVFGDGRLPAAYRGDDSQVEDSDALEDVVERFASLSLQAQTTLRPFLLRPTTPGSWLESSAGAVSTGVTTPHITWGVVNTVNGKAKVWYQHRYAGDQSKADDLALSLDATIWPDLFDELRMKTPLSDSGLPNNGGDGRLDIYLVHIGDRGIAQAMIGCEETPVYILINSARPIGSATQKGILQTVVHEVMHASQFAYLIKETCSEYHWWREASAKWAEDYVYPLANSEQPSALHFLKKPELPLEEDSDEKRPYGAYLFPFYLTHKHAPSLVRTIWEQVKDADSLEAIERSIPGGFEEQWPQFARHTWNRPPVDDYRTWDNLIPGPATQSLMSDLNGAPDMLLPLRLQDEASEGVEHLAARYFHILFSNDDAATVVFYNGYTFELSEQQVKLDPIGPVGTTLVASPLPAAATQNARVEALVKTTGHDWVVQDWTGRGLVRYCRDAPGEKLEELVLIFSNSEHNDRERVIKPRQLPPTVWVSNIGCWQWDGEVNTVENVFDDGPLLTMHAQLRFNRVGSSAWPLVTNVTGEWLTHDAYEPIGSLDWRFSGVDGGGCTWSGNGAMNLTPQNTTLFVANYAISGSLRRSYDGVGETDVLQVIGQRHCPNGTGGPYGWHTWWFPAWPGGDSLLHAAVTITPGDFVPFHVANTGAVEDARDFNAGQGHSHASWRLTAQSAP